MALMKLFAIAVGLIHLVIMYLEMSGNTEVQAKAFDMPSAFVKEKNAQTALKNLGIYNGALGLLIIISTLIFSGQALSMILLLLMGFILVVGIFGGLTVTKKIYLIQVIPALITIFIILF